MPVRSSDMAEGAEAERFRVGASFRWVAGGGTLVVSPGSIVLEADRPTRAFGGAARIVHTDRDVVVVTARLIPPWFNTSLRIHDDHESARVITWVGARRRLSASLRRSGFNVREATTWISRDMGPIRPSGARSR